MLPSRPGAMMADASLKVGGERGFRALQLPGRTSQVVQIVGLENLVDIPTLLLADHAVGHKLAEQVAGSLSRCIRQVLPEGEGVLVIAGKWKRPGRRDCDRRGFSGIE